MCHWGILQVWEEASQLILSNCTAVTALKETWIQNKQIRAGLNLPAAFDLSFYLRAARFQSTEAKQSLNLEEKRKKKKWGQVPQDYHYTEMYAKTLLTFGMMEAFISNLPSENKSVAGAAIYLKLCHGLYNNAFLSSCPTFIQLIYITLARSSQTKTALLNQ